MTLVPFIGRRQIEAVDYQLRMAEARRDYIFAQKAWHIHGRPTRAEALAEVDGTAAQSLTLVAEHT